MTEPDTPARRIAVAVDQGRLALHFGRTDAFAVFTDNGTPCPRAVYRVRTADPPGMAHPHGEHHNEVAALLGDCGTLICGGIGHHAAEILEQQNIRVVVAAVDEGADILILGEMGIGNSTVAAALAAACFGGPVAEWVGPGTGSDKAGIARKVEVIERGLRRHEAVRGDAPVILAALGGREQAAICGAVLAARAARIPVILDGFICTAAAAVLYAADKRLLDHCLVGHASAEPGHRKLLAAIHKRPVLEFDMRLGEGSGAALALGIVRSALACHNGMATFGEAGVSEA